MLTRAKLEARQRAFNKVYFAWMVYLQKRGLPQHEAKPRASRNARAGMMPPPIYTTPPVPTAASIAREVAQAAAVEEATSRAA